MLGGGSGENRLPSVQRIGLLNTIDQKMAWSTEPRSNDRRCFYFHRRLPRSSFTNQFTTNYIFTYLAKRLLGREISREIESPSNGLINIRFKTLLENKGKLQSITGFYRPNSAFRLFSKVIHHIIFLEQVFS